MNPPSAFDRPIASPWVSAREAAELLGVKRASLYAYVSRGKITARPSEGGRGRRYARADIERLMARRDARAGHGAVAAGALRWGEPVLDSAVTAITEEGPAYRGYLATRLAEAGVGFESVAELLWTGEPAVAPRRWPTPPGRLEASLAAVIPRDARPSDALAIALPHLAIADPQRHQRAPGPTLDAARALIRHLVIAIALSGGGRSRASVATEAPSIAAALALAFGLPATRARVAALEVALVLSADHELNPSSFAARVAASAGADLYAAVGAAMATLSGPRHGGVAERVAAMLDEIGDPSRVVRVVQSRLRRGDPVVGFGHPLYPRGDPRVEPILAAARAVGGKKRRLRSLEAVVDAMALAGAPAPSYDIAITGLAVALGLGAAEATAIFAIGRSAGWIAHLLEQRQAGYILRPRARYTGSFPEGAL